MSTEWLEEAGLGKAEPSGGIGVRHEVQAFERGSGGAFAEVVVKRGEKDAVGTARHRDLHAVVSRHRVEAQGAVLKKGLEFDGRTTGEPA